MKQITLQKTELTTDLTPYLTESELEPNKKGKTYHYVAKLRNYVTAKNIQRDFESRMTDLDFQGEDWTLQIATSFLNNLNAGEIIEVVVNIKRTQKFSSVSRSYFLIVDNTSTELTAIICQTPYKAFKSKLELFPELSK